jgi:hypothetical protein
MNILAIDNCISIRYGYNERAFLSCRIANFCIPGIWAKYTLHQEA